MNDNQSEAAYENIRVQVLAFLSALNRGYFDIDEATSCIDRLHVWESPLVRYAPLGERVDAILSDVRVLLYNFDQGQFYIGTKSAGGFERDIFETAFITSLRECVTVKLVEAA